MKRTYTFAYTVDDDQFTTTEDDINTIEKGLLTVSDLEDLYQHSDHVTRTVTVTDEEN